MPHLTPIETCLMDKLKDGERHSKADLIVCMDELAEDNAFYQHIHRLRSKLRKEGLDIANRNQGWAVNYQLMRLLNHAKEE